jgi:Spy/CpxP family protein refolding chaperone
MSHVRSVLVVALVFGPVFVGVAEAEQRGRSRRGFGGRGGPGSLLGLLRMEPVQKDLKLSEEQVGKVNKIGEDLRASMSEEFTALRGVEDRAERRKKMSALSKQLDEKARTQLTSVLSKEQMTRLDQIRMQVRPAIQNLTNKDVAAQLKLTKEQKKKIAGIAKDMRAKQSELFAGMREASREQRGEAYQKGQKLQADADKQALAVLTAEQKTAFEKMKGEKIELPRRRGRR